MPEEKIIIRKTPGIRVKVGKASSDWEVRDKDTDKLQEKGKKT